MELSIIIINYNSHELLLNCLESIYRETKRISFEVIVVDNASPQDRRELILNTYSQVRWIQMDYNAGFARANNEGIKQANAPVMLLLNPDTIIMEAAIENAYHKIMESDAVAAGVQLLNPDGSPQISGNYFMAAGLNYLLPLPYLGKFLSRTGNIFKIKRPNVPEAKQTIEVDWINGAFLMVKKSAIDLVGLMDEDFFLYAEEAEWCSRLKRAGKLLIFGDLHVIHLQGETANATFNSGGKGYYNLYDKKGLQIMVSNLLRIRKQFGMFSFLFIVFVYLIEIILFPFGLLIEKLLRQRKSNYHWWQVKAYAANVALLMKFFPKMVLNKPNFYKVI
jgi:GT2 family glycosyltransferase